MNKEVLKDALYSALSLLNNEIESVVIPDLIEEYSKTIMKIEYALNVLQENG